MNDTSTSAARVAGPSLTDRAYLAIEERIATLELAPGEVLSEAALSKALDIGRTPVREALQRLAREGLVTVLPRRGSLVSRFDISAQLRMLEVRREIERLMARSAAARGRADERETFAALARELAAPETLADGIRFMRLDRRLNDLVAETCRNEFARAAIALMSGLSRRFWFMHYQRAGEAAEPAAAPAAVARTVAAGDEAGAAAASDALMDYIERITRDAVDW